MTGFPYPELNAEKEAEYRLFPINLTRMLLHTQGQTVPYWKYALGFRNAKITPMVRERVILRVGAIADCEYQLVQHKSEALRTGTSQELLAVLVDPRQQEFDDAALTALVKYVDSLVTNVGAEQEALDALRKHFPDNESPKSPCWPVPTCCAPHLSNRCRCPWMTDPSTGPLPMPTCSRRECR
jgi:AhpD family alkylhydroperoxidase